MHKVQKYSIYYILFNIANAFTILLLLVNVMHPCWIKELIYFKAFAYPKLLNSSIYI